MKYKPDWAEARERLTALWNHETLDRPCIAVIAPNGKKTPAPELPANLEDIWLNIEWVKKAYLAKLENTWWGGEAIPSYLTMGGWVLCLGGTPKFAQDTIWFEHVNIDFNGPSPFYYKDGDPWVEKYMALYNVIVEMAGKDDFLVGKPSNLPANDLFSMFMGTEEFLFSLIDHPEWMRNAIIKGAQEQLKLCRKIEKNICEKHDFWYGHGGWMCFWAPQPFTSTQSDVSCMLSPEMFEEFIMPEMDTLGQAYGALWYHLDGGNARQHLPRLLSLPYLKVLQYVPAPCEPANGPEHLDFYRTIQAAGKIVHIGVPKENVLPLVKSLDTSLLMLDVTCNSVEEGQALLKATKKA